jgi:hypothetical protein
MSSHFHRTRQPSAPQTSQHRDTCTTLYAILTHVVLDDLFWLCDRKCQSHGDPSNHPRRWTRRDMPGHFSNRGSPDLSLLPRPQIPHALQFGNGAIGIPSSSNVRSQESHAHKTKDKTCCPPTTGTYCHRMHGRRLKSWRWWRTFPPKLRQHIPLPQEAKPQKQE